MNTPRLRRAGSPIRRLTFACLATLAAGAAILALSATASNRLGPPGEPTIEEQFAARVDERTQAAFAEASRESGVPRDLLVALSWVDSRFHHRDGEPSVDLGYGLMNLRDNRPLGGPAERTNAALAEASALTGFREDDLKRDPVANVRGAAALLRSYLDEEWGAEAEARAPALESWAGAVRRYIKFADDRLADEYLNELYLALEDLGHRIDFAAVGLSGVLEPELVVPPLECGSAEYLFVRDKVPAHPNNYSPGVPNTPRLVVIHVAQGCYTCTLNAFANPAHGASAHYVVAKNGRVGMSLCEDWKGGHVLGFNTNNLGVEHAGFVGQTFPAIQYQASAHLVADVLNRWAIPPDRSHVRGHEEVGSHTDPGPTWDWAIYMGHVDFYYQNPGELPPDPGPQAPPPIQCETGSGNVALPSSVNFLSANHAIARPHRLEMREILNVVPSAMAQLSGLVAEHQAFLDSQDTANPQRVGPAQIAGALAFAQTLAGHGTAELQLYLDELAARAQDTAGMTLAEAIDHVLEPDEEGGGGPPRAPAELVARPVPWQEVLVDLTWEDESDDEDGFLVYRLGGGSPHWQEVGSLGPDETSFRDQVPSIPGGDDPNPAYYFYRVKAHNGAGSADSNRAEARMYGMPPAAPDTLRPRGCVEETFLPLSWHGGRSTSFYVHFVEIPTDREADWTQTGNTAWTPWALTPRWPYMLKVIGQNNIGHGATSAPEFFVPQCDPTEAPLLEAPPPGCLGTTTPEIRWSAVPGALGYHLRLSRAADEAEVCAGGVGISAPATGWSGPRPGDVCPLWPLAPGVEVRVKVKAHTGVDGPYSNLRFFVPLCGPASLGSASPISPAGGTVPSNRPIYTWEAAAQAESYTVRVVTDTVPQVPAGQQTFAAAAACDGTVCSARPGFALADGPYRWWIDSARGASTTTGPYAPMTVAHQPLTLAVGDLTAAEGSGVARFTVALSQPAPLPVDLTAGTADGTAHAPADYAALAGPLRIPGGQAAGVVEVPLVADGLHEEAETLRLLLADPVGATIADGEGIATIADADPPPTLQVADVTVLEGAAGSTTAQVTVTLSGATALPASVTLTGADCTATGGSDYARPPSTQLSFPTGTTRRTVQVSIFGDAAFEGDEVFLALLDGAVNATIADGWGQGRLKNDDPRRKGDPPPIPPRADFDGDGRGDLLWRNADSGALVVWRMDGSDRIAGVGVTPPVWPEAGWQVAATGDFDGDGDPDLLWRNEASGNLSLWTMQGTEHVGGTLLAGEPDLDWRIAGVGDFDRDGDPDLAWRHETAGALQVWRMDGATRVETLPLPPPPESLAWRVAALGDFDGDAWPDLLWRHDTSGALVVWFMEGTAKRDGTYLDPPELADLQWQVAGVWDVDDDGAADLVWQHAASKRLVVWYLAGTQRLCGAYLNPDAPQDLGWSVVGLR